MFYFKKNLLLLVFAVCFFVLFPAFSLAVTKSCSTTVFCRDASCSSTINLTFPPGGGTIANRAFVTLPLGAKISSASVEMVMLGSAIGTPYIWIPNTASGTVAQLRTKDTASGARGSLVKLYTNADISPDTFSSHSRITVIPGGDIWIANRGNGKVIRLKPKPSPSEEYEYGGSANVGANCVRGVTFDNKGYLWAGTCGGSDCDRGSAPNNDRLRVFCAKEAGCGAFAFGAMMAESVNDLCHYGMIGDRRGYVWTVGEGSIRSYTYISGAINNIDSDSVPGSYGLGMDNDTNLWVAKWDTGVYKVTRDTGGNIISISSAFSSGLSANSGVAVDGIGNVWVDGYNTNKASRFSLSGGFLGNYDAGSTPHGAAIDFDNNAWLINYGGGSPVSQPILNPSNCGTAGLGSATVYSSSGTYIGTYTTCGNNPYNYSDMTGFRATVNIFNPGFGGDIPITSTTISGWHAALQTTLATCSCDHDGVPATGDECYLNAVNDCVVPLSFSSTIKGDYILQNLNIVCTENIPDMTGGIVPCGRLADNPATPYNETENCNLCHVFIMFQIISTFLFEISAIVAVFFIIIGALIYMTSAGEQSRMGQGKKAIKWALFGLAIIILAWLAVTIILVALGYINPLGGQWNIVSC